MAKRRLKNESLDNVGAIVNLRKIDSVASIDPILAQAYEDDKKAEEHVTEVEEKLNEVAEDALKTRSPENPELNVNNTYTAPLKLDESISDFTLTEADDARSRKVYEDDTEDDYLDYDMFDFIYGLVTDCWPKPLNPLNHRLRKFMYAGSDDYLKTNNYNGVPQVASNGNYIEVYSDDIHAFDDIIEIAKLYKFKTDGPTERRNKSAHYAYNFRIEVPSNNGYPEMVEDYFNDLGMPLEKVMPADWCATYRKKQDKINKEVEKRIAEREVEKIISDNIRKAALDDTLSLEACLDKLYDELDASGYTYQKNNVKNKFLKAFAD